MKLRKRDFVRALRVITEGGCRDLPSYLREEAQAVFRRTTRRWVLSANIQGFGVSNRVSDDTEQRETALKIYVVKKYPLKTLRRRNMIIVPKKLRLSCFDDAIPIDVEEIGRLQFETGIKPGFGIATRSAKGTLGAYVKKRDGSPGMYLLSCAHVIADAGRAAAGAEIFHPDADGRLIAKLTDSADLHPSSTCIRNSWDAAIAKVTNPHVVTPTWRAIGRVTGFGGTITKRMKVTLVGARSKQNEGKVKDTDMVVTPLTFKHADGTEKKYLFKNLVRCSPMSSPGDSGATVIASESRKIIGLHMAGNDSESVFCRIDPVFDHFEVDPVLA